MTDDKGRLNILEDDDEEDIDHTETPALPERGEPRPPLVVALAQEIVRLYKLACTTHDRDDQYELDWILNKLEQACRDICLGEISISDCASAITVLRDGIDNKLPISSIHQMMDYLIPDKSQ